LRKGGTKDLTVTVGELPEDRVASRDSPRGAKPAEVAANRLGLVVAELTADQKRDMKLQGGLFVTEVKAEARGEFRRGDVLLTLVHRGQQTELKSAEQLGKLLAGLDKNVTVTLHIRRGESAAFVTVSGLSDKG
jgi:serine protease Do